MWAMVSSMIPSVDYLHLMICRCHFVVCVVYLEATFGVCTEADCLDYVWDMVLRSMLYGEDIFQYGGLCMM